MIILRDNKVLIELEMCAGLDDLARFKQAIHSMLINLDTENQTVNFMQDITLIGYLLKSMDFSEDQMWKMQAAITKNKELESIFAGAA